MSDGMTIMARMQMRVDRASVRQAAQTARAEMERHGGGTIRHKATPGTSAGVTEAAKARTQGEAIKRAIETQGRQSRQIEAKERQMTLTGRITQEAARRSGVGGMISRGSGSSGAGSGRAAMVARLGTAVSAAMIIGAPIFAAKFMMGAEGRLRKAFRDADVSGPIAMVQARYEVQDILRRQRRGAFLAARTEGLNRELQPFLDTASSIGAGASYAAMGITEKVLRWMNEAPPIKKLMDWFQRQAMSQADEEEARKKNMRMYDYFISDISWGGQRANTPSIPMPPTRLRGRP